MLPPYRNPPQIHPEVATYFQKYIANKNPQKTSLVLRHHLKTPIRVSLSTED